MGVKAWDVDEYDSPNIKAISPLDEARARIGDLRAQAKDHLDKARKKSEVAHIERERAEVELYAISAAMEALSPTETRAMPEGGF